MRYELAPSILSADFGHLADQIALVEKHAGRIHIDVMDGHFVPNLSMGPVVVRGVRPVTALPLEVHLMVTDPQPFFEPFHSAGADTLMFHLEVVEDPTEAIASIRALGADAGIAINPATSADLVLPLLDAVQVVNVMTVNPGFGGQEFLRTCLPKVQQIRHALIERGFSADIEVDGGIDARTVREAAEAGANVFVAGNAVFGARDPRSVAEEIEGILKGLGKDEREDPDR